MLKSMREKCMPKEREENKRKKDSPYFQIKGIHQKGRES
jgi:hypothetical protein